MHTYLQGGLMSAEVFNLISACKAAGIPVYDELRAICSSDWRFCKMLAKRGRSAGCLFSASRERACGREFKAGASELLTALPFVRHYAERVLRARNPTLHPHVECFVMACRCIDLILALKARFDACALATTAAIHSLPHTSSSLTATAIRSLPHT